jgi:hypothetical protein
MVMTKIFYIRDIYVGRIIYSNGRGSISFETGAARRPRCAAARRE